MARTVWQWPTSLCACLAAEPVDEVAGRRSRNRASSAHDAANAQAPPAKAKAVPPKADGKAGSAKGAAAKAGAPSARAGVTSAKRGAAKRGAAKRRAAEPASDAMPADGTAPEVDGAEPADADALHPESPELLSGREAAAEVDAPAAGKAQTRGAAEEPVAAAGGALGEVAGAAASKSEGLAADPSEALPAATTVLSSLVDEDGAGGCSCVWCAWGFGVLPATGHQLPLIMKPGRCCSLWLALSACTETDA